VDGIASHTDMVSRAARGRVPDAFQAVLIIACPPGRGRGWCGRETGIAGYAAPVA
jgi:hypothetical protein